MLHDDVSCLETPMFKGHELVCIKIVYGIIKSNESKVLCCILLESWHLSCCWNLHRPCGWRNHKFQNSEKLPVRLASFLLLKLASFLCLMEVFHIHPMQGMLRSTLGRADGSSSDNTGRHIVPRSVLCMYKRLIGNKDIPVLKVTRVTMMESVLLILFSKMMVPLWSRLLHCNHRPDFSLYLGSKDTN